MCQSYFFLLQESIFVQTKAYINFIAFSPVPLENMQDFFYKIDSAFFLSGQSINSGLLMFGSQAWGSVCHFTSVLHGFKSSWHIVLFIYHPGCRNKKNNMIFQGPRQRWRYGFYSPPNSRKKFADTGRVPGFSNHGFRTIAQHPLFQILIKPSSLIARVHKPADFEIQYY